MTTSLSRALLAVVLLLAMAMTGLTAVGASTDAPTCESFDPTTAAAEACDIEGAWTQIGQNNFEPTMGVTPDGGLYMATTPARGVAVGWRAGVARAASLEEGLAGPTAWDDVQPQIAGYSNPPETNDPYAYVDPSTGRIFSFHMSPILLCSILSFSDDGGETWTTPPVGCGPSGAWDHQTMVAAPPTDGVVTVGYPNVLVQCVNSVYAEMCARSLDGGLTWGAGYPAYPNPNLGLSSLCGTQTGHLTSDRDGIFYLPSPDCGNQPTVYVSSDSGLTWTKRIIHDESTPFTDPAIDVDAAGNIHATWVTNNNRLLYAVSTDKAVTWSDPVSVTTTDVHADLPALVAGDDGKIAIAFAGTRDLPQGYDTDVEDAKTVSWGAYLAVSTDAQPGGTPTFQTINTTGDDPIQRGLSCASRCAYLVDFIDVVLTPEGAPVGAFSDGCDNAACISGTSGNNVNDRGRGMIATADVDLCEDVCHQFAPAEDAQTVTAASLMAPTMTHEPFVLTQDLGEARVRAMLEGHLTSLGW